MSIPQSTFLEFPDTLGQWWHMKFWLSISGNSSEKLHWECYEHALRHALLVLQVTMFIFWIPLLQALDQLAGLSSWHEVVAGNKSCKRGFRAWYGVPTLFCAVSDSPLVSYPAVVLWKHARISEEYQYCYAGYAMLSLHTCGLVNSQYVLKNLQMILMLFNHSQDLIRVVFHTLGGGGHGLLPELKTYLKNK